jgi:hypothetical protein
MLINAAVQRRCIKKYGFYLLIYMVKTKAGILRFYEKIAQGSTRIKEKRINDGM